MILLFNIQKHKKEQFSFIKRNKNKKGFVFFLLYILLLLLKLRRCVNEWK